LDAESAQWLRVLTGAGPEHDRALRRLHELLLRTALHEVHRRATSISGPELTDIAHQAASDAMLAILRKLPAFRGESRFTTWAYKFVVIEVSSKLGRHYWRNPPVPVNGTDWDSLPDRLGLDPDAQAESRELLAAIRAAVERDLTDHQRRVFVAVVVNGVPLDALVAELGASRNTIYKVVFDARRKIRATLVANGYLDDIAAGRS
jgi:RNA polymerase sigma-70 factor (ECF subfamily)